MCISQGSGSHLQISSVTAEIVQEMHKNGKIVAVWVDLTTPKHLYEENDAFYKRLYDMGVDMLTTDHPVSAQQAL